MLMYALVFVLGFVVARMMGGRLIEADFPGEMCTYYECNGLNPDIETNANDWSGKKVEKVNNKTYCCGTVGGGFGGQEPKPCNTCHF